MDMDSVKVTWRWIWTKDESFDEPRRPEYHVEPKTLIMFEYV